MRTRMRWRNCYKFGMTLYSTQFRQFRLGPEISHHSEWHKKLKGFTWAYEQFPNKESQEICGAFKEVLFWFHNSGAAPVQKKHNVCILLPFYMVTHFVSDCVVLLCRLLCFFGVLQLEAPPLQGQRWLIASGCCHSQPCANPGRYGLWLHTRGQMQSCTETQS